MHMLVPTKLLLCSTKSAFSTAGHIVKRKRHVSNAESVNTLHSRILSNDWLWYACQVAGGPGAMALLGSRVLLSYHNLSINIGVMLS